MIDLDLDHLLAVKRHLGSMDAMCEWLLCPPLHRLCAWSPVLARSLERSWGRR